MHFFDDSLLPENQEKLVIQAAPYGPEWLPSDSDDIPVSIDEQVQRTQVANLAKVKASRDGASVRTASRAISSYALEVMRMRDWLLVRM